ncbi:hypothetical protein ILUMI_06449 [Ignelater luminosus]|uniref:Uncharacterized protein n=1 Tax=Ignelater luminosus TaxID=2038154 RepID=A0A8K0D5D4_IGNLU|nr:hypothetical protein ILUMI_06449 [Ignelater luminosus]
MEWFGITLYGFPDYFKDLMRPDYKEPEVQPDLYEVIAKGTNKRFTELVSELDCYIGRADGYAYKSYDRLIRMRKKGMFKPVGPTDMYNYPGTDFMRPGFWLADPDLKGETWYKPRTFQPKPYTEISQYVHAAKKIDKFFKL